VLDEQVRKANRDNWTRKMQGLLEWFVRHSARTSMQDEVGHWSSLARCASTYARWAFNFLAMEREEEATWCCRRAIEAAEEALRSEDFEPRFRRLKPWHPGATTPPEIDATVKLTSKQVHIEKVAGKEEALGALYYARWFLTDERPMDLWAEVVRLHREYYDLHSKRYERDELLLLMYTQAEQYEEAIEHYRRICRRPLQGPPTSLHFRRSAHHALYVVSEFALGRPEFEHFARAGIEHWHEQCQDWSTPGFFIAESRRLGWAWLRGRNFTGVTDVRTLIRELRGC